MDIRKSWLRDLPQQFQGKKNIDILITALAKQFEEIEDVLGQINEMTDISTATGINLDYIGTIVGLTRKEAGILCGKRDDYVMPDERYRMYLRHQILVNTSDCTYPSIRSGIRYFWDGPLHYEEREDEPATMIWTTGEMEGPIDTTPLFETPLIRAAGVKLKLYAITRVEMETSVAGIGSGLGFSFTSTDLPFLEREIDYSAKVYIGSAMSRVTEDRIPTIERKYRFASNVNTGSSVQSVMETPIGGVVLQ